VRLALTAPPRYVLLTSTPPIILASCISCLVRVATCRANRPSTTSFAQAPAAAASRVHGKLGKTSGDPEASFNQSPSDADEAGARLPPPVRRLCLAEGAVSFTPVPAPRAGFGASLALFESDLAASKARRNLRLLLKPDPELCAVTINHNREKQQQLSPIRPPTPPTVGMAVISRNSGSWETEEGGSWRPHFLCWLSS